MFSTGLVTVTGPGGKQMYLFTRSARLNSFDGMEWASNIRGHAAEVLNNDVQLWTTVFSPGSGLLSWTSWWDSLASLESAMAGLVGSAKYLELATQGRDFIEGGVDDLLSQTVFGEPAGDTSARYVGVVQAVAANGRIGDAMAAGVGIAQKAAEVAVTPTMFVRGITGAYGGVGWIAGYENLAAMDAAETKLAADPSWLSLVDGSASCFIADPTVTQSVIFMKVG